eukprot:TRINITY_DN498_c0_g1_i2.p1 TRINITY_DN498_c0_g1~~TRINITY_DN498_c0_g1_i2.p1  ORF type:complete len:399 (+),score=97.52 TRINITY_DN498_c0_g1_i2:119-1198(+)
MDTNKETHQQELQAKVSEIASLQQEVAEFEAQHGNYEERDTALVDVVQCTRINLSIKMAILTEMTTLSQYFRLWCVWATMKAAREEASKEIQWYQNCTVEEMEQSNVQQLLSAYYVKLLLNATINLAGKNEKKLHTRIAEERSGRKQLMHRVNELGELVKALDQERGTLREKVKKMASGTSPQQSPLSEHPEPLDRVASGVIRRSLNNIDNDDISSNSSDEINPTTPPSNRDKLTAREKRLIRDSENSKIADFLHQYHHIVASRDAAVEQLEACRADIAMRKEALLPTGSEKDPFELHLIQLSELVDQHGNQVELCYLRSVEFRSRDICRGLKFFARHPPRLWHEIQEEVAMSSHDDPC